MFIDTHMHIGDDFGVEPDLYVKNASDAQVKVLIASFCEKDDIMLSTKFVEKYKIVILKYNNSNKIKKQKLNLLTIMHKRV